MSRRTTKKSRAAQAALPLKLSKRQARALYRVIDYVFREEERHFYSDPPDERGKHIFHDVRVAALAVRYTSNAHLRMLDKQDAEYWSSSQN